ncbi:MAG: MFS transporter [Desulfonatronovibrio sp.]
MRKSTEIVQHLWTTEKKDSEPWYWGYLFQGCVVLGIAPILLPIIVAQGQGPAHVGLVVAMFYTGQVISPLIGKLADRTRQFGLIFLGSFALLALGLMGFALVTDILLWCLFAFIQGAGAGAGNTTAYSYIVEFRPEPEWDARLGWLQTFYGTGQAAGLLIAAAIQSQAMVGLWACALLMIPGFLLARIGLPGISRRKSARTAAPLTHNVPAMTHARTPASILRHYEHLSRPKLKALGAQWWSYFGLFMLSWFLLMLGTWMVYNLYPLLMKNAFNIPAGLSSLYYGIAALIGIFFYAPSGSWAVKFGSSKVVFMGIIATLGSISGMAVMLMFGQNVQAWLVPPVFILLPVAWSPMIVAGTALTGKLCSGSQGSAMGLFNATTAMASVSAALLAGGIAQKLGYGAICWTAAIVVGTGLLLFIPVLRYSQIQRTL